MRQPTNLRDAFAWYRAATLGEGEPLPTVIDQPECGYFAIRAVRGGVLVPARIWIDQEIDEHGELTRDEVMLCEINGKMCDPVESWARLAGHPVPFAKYQHHLHLNAYAGWHDLDVPEARTDQRIDWLRIEPPVFKETA